MYVDFFGLCGIWFCGGRIIFLSDCLKNVFWDYKFYLVFENMICFDYIIEKLFNLFLYDFEIVLVVNGFFNVVKYIFNGIFVNY